MLKLTRALLEKSSQVRVRLIQSLKSRASQSVLLHRSGHFETFDESSLTGLLYLIDAVSIGGLADESIQRPQEELYAISQATLFLRQLRVSELVELFLSLEDLVLSSGQGTIFQQWRERERSTLILWIAYLERSRFKLEQLSAMKKLTDDQRKILEEPKLIYRSLSMRVMNHCASYVRGNGALAKRSVLKLSLSEPFREDLLCAHFRNSLQEKENAHHHSSDLRDHEAFIFTSHKDLPLISFISFLRMMISQDEQRRQRAIDWSEYPLSNHFFNCSSLPQQHLLTPNPSRRAWLFRELKELFSSLVFCPLFAIVARSHEMSECERILWELWFTICREGQRPFLLILLDRSLDPHVTHQKAELDRARWSSHGADYNEAHVHSFLTRSEFLNDHGDLVHPHVESLNHWTKRWTDTLLGHVSPSGEVLLGEDRSSARETRNNSPYFERSLWREVLGERSPQLQSYLLIQLGVGAAVLRACGLSLSEVFASRSELLCEAGWLSTIAELELSSLVLIDDWVHETKRQSDLHIKMKPELKEALTEVIVELFNAFVYRDSLHSVSPLLCQAQLLIALVNTFNLNPHEDSRLYALVCQARELIQGLFVRLEHFALLDSKGHLVSEGLSIENDSHVSQPHDTHPSLTRWIKLELRDLKMRARKGERSNFAQLQALEEGAFAIADLECLAEIEYQRTELLLREGDLIGAIKSLNRAHTLYTHLLMSKSARRCRLDLALVLSQSGFQEIAQSLINAEREVAVLSQQSDDQLLLVIGLNAIHLGDWLSALSALTNISEASGDVITLRALAHLKQFEQLYLSDRESFDQVGRRSSKSQTLSSQISRVIELSKESSHQGLLSFDMQALNTWIELKATSYLGEMDLTLDRYESLDRTWSELSAVNPPSIPTRGGLYVAWSQTILSSALEEKGEQDRASFSRSIEGNLSELRDTIKALWSRSYQELATFLKTHSESLSMMAPPHPQARSYVATFARQLSQLESASENAQRLWELDEDQNYR